MIDRSSRLALAEQLEQQSEAIELLVGPGMAKMLREAAALLREARPDVEATPAYKGCEWERPRDYSKPAERTETPTLPQDSIVMAAKAGVSMSIERLDRAIRFSRENPVCPLTAEECVTILKHDLDVGLLPTRNIAPSLRVGVSASAAGVNNMDTNGSEVGYLIETGSAPTRYWDGHGTRDIDFTEKPELAIRFARLEDAEIVRCWLLDQWRHFTRSVQHAWPEAVSSRPAGEQMRECPLCGDLHLPSIDCMKRGFREGDGR